MRRGRTTEAATHREIHSKQTIFFFLMLTLVLNGLDLRDDNFPAFY